MRAVAESVNTTFLSFKALSDKKRLKRIDLNTKQNEKICIVTGEKCKVRVSIWPKQPLNIFYIKVRAIYKNVGWYIGVDRYM